MNLKTFFGTASLLLSLFITACNSETTAADTNTGAEAAAIKVTWVFCANEYSGCTFSGMRDVRFTKGNVTTTKTFFGGLDYCRADNFGLPQIPDGPAATCDYSNVYKSKTIKNPMPGMAGLGATVNVPLGFSGYNTPRIQPTTDLGAPSDIGAFRIPCALSHFNFDDPLVYPNQPGKAHLHMFFGNTGTNAYSTADSIANSGNSTCGGGILDRTAYWVPALIDSAGKAVLPYNSVFYYKTGYNGIKPSDVKQIPVGLRMIAGDAKNAAPGGAQGQGKWTCTVEPYIGHKDNIRDIVTDPRCPAGNGLILNVVFPQCWDGLNLDSANHKSHMSYVVNGACPNTHPVAIPEITYNNPNSGIDK